MGMSMADGLSYPKLAQVAPRPVSAYSQMLFATMLFGLGNVAQKSLFDDIGMWSALGLRGLIAAMALLPFAMLEMQRLSHTKISTLRHAPAVMVTFAAAITCQQIGAGYTSATNLGFLINASVVFTPVILWLAGKSGLPRFIWPSCALCFVGAGLMAGSSVSAFGFGDIMCLVAAVFYALWMIQLEKLMADVDAPATIAFAQWLLPALGGLAAGAVLETTPSTAIASALPELLFLGTLASGLGYMMAAKAQSRMPACIAAICYPLEAIFGAGFAYLLLSEHLSLTGIAGATLIFASILLVQWGCRSKAQSVG